MSNIIQALPFYLNTPIGGSDTTIQVKKFRDTRGNYITAMPSGTAKMYVTIEPASPTGQEIISFTGITDNGNQVVTLTGVERNLNPVPPYTALPANVTHGNNATCIVTNNPQVFLDVVMTNEARTITAPITFGVSPSVPSGVNPTDPINKSQLDLAVIGAVPASSTSALGTVRQSADATKTLGTVTITIASPAVLTLNSHGLTLNDTVRFTTSGTLPTGIVAGTTYYVISAGLTVNTFQISLTAGGSAVNTSVGQSGTHTLYRTTPYAVNDQDSRLPTQAENDAMQGTSGTPSNTNRYVTNDDTSATPSAGKVARYGADGGLSIDKLVRNFIARENVNTGQGVSLYPYQSDGGVLLDSTASCGATPNTGGSIAVANNTNRKMLIFASAVNNSTVVTCTVGGNAATQIQGATSPNNYAFYIDAPATGSPTIAFNTTVAWTAYSIYNAAQGAPENSAITTASSGAISLATVADGAMTFTGCGSGQDNITGQGLSGAGAYGGVLNVGDATGRVVSCYSGQVFPNAVSVAATLATGVFSLTCISISIAPVTAPVYGGVILSSASNNTISQYVNRSTAFVGFVSATTTAGNIAPVVTSGAAYVSTTLVGNLTYYLSNSTGSVGTVAGTNSKKVGQALNSSTLNVIQVI